MENGNLTHTMTMTERQEILGRMKIEDYFERYSINNKLVEPEYACIKVIREKLESATQLTMSDAEEILKIYNRTHDLQQYHGSGWLDYQLHLRSLLTVDNFQIEVDKRNGRMRLKTA